MMDAKQIKEWLDTLPDDAQIGIDDGGLTLQVVGGDEYLEVGGLPRTWCDFCEEFINDEDLELETNCPNCHAAIKGEE